MNNAIRAYALVGQLKETLKDLMIEWQGHELDHMLEANYPFNQCISDMWADVQRWHDAMPDPHPVQPQATEQGKTYLFVNGLYQGEFDSQNDAAMRACELKGIDKDEVKNSGEGYADYVCNLFENDNQDIEIIHETDYRFYQGDNHPANRMELKEFWNEFTDAEFSCGDYWYKGKHRPLINWNGFACPYFTYETAEAILRDVCNLEDAAFRYDESRDMFILTYQGVEDHEWEGLLFDGVKMYAIGAFNWTWSVRNIEPKKTIRVHDMANDLLKSSISNFEIHACKQVGDHVEQCDDNPNPDFWSVYVRYIPTASNGNFGGCDCIADCDTFEEASQFVKLMMEIFKRMFMMQTTEKVS